MQGLISVIVPIYNGEEYIPKMLESLQKQTYTNFEVLLVEDHSTDTSKSIIRKISEKDHRFKVLEPSDKMGTAGRGQCYALPFCRGDYHFYLSQDDFMDADLFEKCIAVFESTDADVVIPNCILYDGGSNQRLGKYPLDKNYLEPIQSKKAFILSLDWEIHGFTMEKMSLFKSVGLTGEYYNDEEYRKRILFLQAKRIYFVDSNFYYRQDNPEAITKKRKYFQIDVLKTDFLLYKLLCKVEPDRSIQEKYLARLLSEYGKWWLRGIKYGLFWGNGGYFVRKLLELFVPVCKEKINLRKSQ